MIESVVRWRKIFQGHFPDLGKPVILIFQMNPVLFTPCLTGQFGSSAFTNDIQPSRISACFLPLQAQAEEQQEMWSDFLGECTAEFPADGEWLEGHEKVFINGEPVLLRRCSIMCNYGGCVTILVSGQPE